MLSVDVIVAMGKQREEFIIPLLDICEAICGGRRYDAGPPLLSPVQTEKTGFSEFFPWTSLLEHPHKNCLRQLHPITSCVVDLIENESSCFRIFS